MVGIKKYMRHVADGLMHFKRYEYLMMAVMIIIAARSMISAFADPETASNPPWLTVLNFISAICGIICIFFTAKAHMGNFVFSIVNTIVYAVYLWYWRIYGTMLLEVFVYLPIGVISWIKWAQHRQSTESPVTKAKKMRPYQYLISAAVVVILSIVLHSFLSKLDGETVWLDAITVSIGLVATTLEMLRYREQYVWWLITDFVAVAMFIQHFDPVYLTKKSIYLIMAIIGLINWVKLSKMNTVNE